MPHNKLEQAIIIKRVWPQFGVRPCSKKSLFFGSYLLRLTLGFLIFVVLMAPLAFARRIVVEARYRLIMSRDSELCPLLVSIYNGELTKVLGQSSLMTSHSYDVFPNPSAPTKTRFEQTDISAFTKAGLRTPAFIVGGPDGEGVAKVDLYNDGKELPVLITAYQLGGSFYSKLYVLHHRVYSLSKMELERSLLLSGGVADTSLVAEDITLSGRFNGRFRPPGRYPENNLSYLLRDWPVSGGLARAFSQRASDDFPAIDAESIALFEWKYNFVIADESTDLLLGPEATSTIDVYRMTTSGPDDICYIYLPRTGSKTPARK